MPICSRTSILQRTSGHIRLPIGQFLSNSYKLDSLIGRRTRLEMLRKKTVQATQAKRVYNPSKKNSVLRIAVDSRGRGSTTRIYVTLIE